MYIVLGGILSHAIRQIPICYGICNAADKIVQSLCVIFSFRCPESKTKHDDRIERARFSLYDANIVEDPLMLPRWTIVNILF